MDQSQTAREAWGRALKNARQAKGLTQMDICRETGAAGAAVYRWEAGRVTPQARFVRKLREMFPELPDPPRDPEETSETSDDERPSATGTEV